MRNTMNARRGENGSAYIVALLALAVLTILGLSLVLITGTEVQVGANERTVTRTFYSADSGVALAAAKALASGQYSGSTVLLNETQVGSSRVADRIEVSNLVTTLAVPCDWCPYNDDGVPEFWKVHHVATATAERVAWSGAGLPPVNAKILSRKTTSAMFEFQPWPAPPPESMPSDPAVLAKIKF
ncbi:MAG TPA: pilus assembly PilX N-terminal domain-containing protein [Thermoanaerobaculia bacterium]|nr:pilus assembly PilX N-terminal domain-containing protein [Thermoanaerobaculia bacterium]